MKRILLVLMLPACIQTEGSISRQGLLGGTAKRGGLGLNVNLLASTYRETGTQNIAAGIDAQMLDETEGGTVGTLGGGARFAQQIDSIGHWRAFTRASFGLGPCQVSSCSGMHTAEHRYALETQLGFERMLMAPDRQQPQDSGSISVEFGAVYTRMSDAMIGTGDFIGLAIGLRIGVNTLSGSHDGSSK